MHTVSRAAELSVSLALGYASSTGSPHS